MALLYSEFFNLCFWLPGTLGLAEHEKSKAAVDFLSLADLWDFLLLADLRDHRRASCTTATPGAPPRLAPAAARGDTTSSGRGWKALLHGFDLSRVRAYMPNGELLISGFLHEESKLFSCSGSCLRYCKYGD
jgi:hypothetical protein